MLLIDAGLSATLPVIRALRADGAAVRLAVAEGAIGAARLAGGCAGYVRHPRLEDADAGFERLLAFIRQHGIDVVLPLSDAATAALDRRARATPNATSRWRSRRRRRWPTPGQGADPGGRPAGARDVRGPRHPGSPTGPHAVDPAQFDHWPVLVKPRDADGARGIHLVDGGAGPP